jgi:hypothetical protein
MSYVIGFGKEGAKDLGRRYVGDLEEGGWIRRVKWDEDDLRQVSSIQKISSLCLRNSSDSCLFRN